VSSFVETLRQLGPSRLAVMGGVLVGLLMFFVFVSMRVSTPELKLLYTDLSTADSASIAAKLEESGIRYSVSADGTKVMVPDPEVGRARMLLAKEGLPNGGSMGYELFDQQSGYGTTNFIQNINQVRALEGELTRTIASVDGVKSARVHLVLPQRELFSRDSRPSSASVFVALKAGGRLGSEQIVAIQHLVASAVPDLKASNVSIIDSEGNLLARGGDDDTSLMSMKAEEMRRSYEQRMTRAVEDLVGRVVGYDRVRATVTADLNFDRVSTNEELFDPATQVVRSSQTVEDSSTEREPPSGDVSVQNNLPGIAGDLYADAKPTAENNRVEETTNYEISKTVRTMNREIGEVKKLSVAVLVDGTYTVDDKGNKTYTPRSEDEVNRIKELVKSAIGYDESRGDKIDVANLQFATVDAGTVEDASLLFGFERSDLLRAAEILTVAVMIILVVLLVLQPMVSRLLTTPDARSASGDDEFDGDLLASRPASPALTGPGAESFKPPEVEEEESLIDMKQVEGKVKASSVRKVEDIVSTYPTETVSVLRSWMSQEN
jgi:flagellar M-ring protein FliF